MQKCRSLSALVHEEEVAMPPPFKIKAVNCATKSNPIKDDCDLQVDQGISYLDYIRPSMRLSRMDVDHPDLHLVVIIQSPNKILSASIDLCNKLGFSLEEIQHRSLSILYGPKTDTTAILWAIKSIHTYPACSEIDIPSIKIYSSSGSFCRYRVGVSLRNTGVPLNTQCRLQLEPIDTTGTCTVQCSRRCSMSSAYVNPRSHYNFITGLQIHASLKCATAEATL